MDSNQIDRRCPFVDFVSLKYTREEKLGARSQFHTCHSPSAKTIPSSDKLGRSVCQCCSSARRDHLSYLHTFLKKDVEAFSSFW